MSRYYKFNVLSDVSIEVCEVKYCGDGCCSWVEYSSDPYNAGDVIETDFDVDRDVTKQGVLHAIATGLVVSADEQTERWVKSCLVVQ